MQSVELNQHFLFCTHRNKCRLCAPIAQRLPVKRYQRLEEIKNAPNAICLLCLSDFGSRDETLTRSLLRNENVLDISMLTYGEHHRAAADRFSKRFRCGDLTPIAGHLPEFEVAVEPRNRKQEHPARPSSAATLESNAPTSFTEIGHILVPISLAKLIERYALTEEAFLITGETGTGKSELARIAHAKSNRSSGPFVEVNCAALTGSLFESELFGHEKGSFTGADTRHEGLVSAANGGTLFLDEVGELPLPLQAKLLTLLQTGQFRAVGSTTSQTANFRCITATNIDLHEATSSGKFRRDLLHRIEVLTIKVPPLRETPDILNQLINRTLQEFGARYSIAHPTITIDARCQVMSQPWYGNYRELSNAFSRALLLSDDNKINTDTLELTSTARPGITDLIEWRGRTLRSIEDEALKKMLGHFRNNKAKTARALGISESGLHLRLKKIDD
jgi:DNA-binding NtrC family response regulator